MIFRVPSSYSDERAPQAVLLWTSLQAELRTLNESPVVIALYLVLPPDEERLAARSGQHAAAPSVEVKDELLFLVAAQDEPPFAVAGQNLVLLLGEHSRLERRVASRSVQDSVPPAAAVEVGWRAPGAPPVATV